LQRVVVTLDIIKSGS